MSNYKELYNTIDSPIALITKDYQLEFVNESFASFVNCKKDKLMGEKLMDVAVNQWPQDFKSKIDACLQGQKLSLKIDSHTKVSYTIKLSPHRNHTDTIVGVFMVISQALNKPSAVSNNLHADNYVHLVNALQDSLFILQDELIKLVNLTLCKVSGYTEAELLGQAFTKFIAPEEIEKIYQIHQKRTKGECVSLSYESVALTKKGKRILVEITIVSTVYNDKPAWQVVLRNISAYKAAIKELADSKEKYRFLSETTLDGLLIHKNGILQECNQAFLNITGGSRAEAIGANLFDLLPSEQSRKTIQTQFQKKHAKPYIVEVIRKDGSVLKAEIEGHETVYKGETVRLVSFKDVTERIITEEKLQKSLQEITHTQNRFKGLIENAPDGVAIINADHEMVYGSPNAGTMFGYTKEDVFGKQAAQFVHADDLPLIVETINKVIDKPDYTQKLLYRFKHKNGEYRWLETTFTNLLNEPAIEGIVINFRDITERKNTKLELENSRNLLRNFIDHLPDDAWAKDMEGRITMVNKSVKETTLGRTDLIGKTAHEILPKEVAETYALTEKQVLLSGKTIVTEETVPGKNGMRDKVLTKFPLLNAEGEITGIGAIAHDITQRKKAEQELRKQKDFLWLLIDNMPNQIFWKDKNLVYKGCNKTFADVVGLDSPKKIKGKTDFDFMRETDYSSDYQKWDKQVINKGEAVYNIEEPYVNADGKEGIVLTSKIPLFDENNTVNGILGFCVDITEIRKTVNEAKRNYNFANALLKSLSIPTFYKDIDGKYTGCNKAFESFHGISANELIGKTVDEVWDRNWAKQKRLIDIETLTKLNKNNFEIDILDQKGNEKRVVYNENIIYDENNEAAGLIGSFLDISHRAQEEKLKSAQLRLIEKSLSQNVNEIIKSFLDEAEKLTSSQISFYHFLSDDQEHILLQEWSDNTASKYCKVTENPENYPVSKAGVWVDCVYAKKPVVHNDYESLSHKKGLPQGHSPLTRELVVPVIRGEKIKAIFGVGNKPALYNQEDIDIVQRLADIAWEIIDRKLVQDELAKSEEKFKSYIENAPYGVNVNDEKGNFLEANIESTRITGYTNAELLKMNITDVIPAEDCHNPIPGIQDLVQKGKPFNVDIVFVNKQGNKGVLHINSIQISKNRFLSFVSDITQQKRNEQELEESRNKLAKIFEVAPAGIGKVVNRVLTEVNPVFCNMLGYTKEELLGKNARLIYPSQEDYDKVGKDKYEQIRKTGTGRVETRFRKKNGKIIDIDMASTQIDDNDLSKGIIFTALNITDKNNYLKRVLQLLNDQKTILENDPSFIWYKDTQNNIIRVTKSVADFTGLPAEEIEGKHSSEVYPDMADSYYNDDREVIKTGKPKMRVIEPLHGPDGTTKWLLTNKIPVFADGKVTGIAVFATDITEVMAVQQELKTKNELLKLEKKKVLENEERHRFLFENMTQGVVYQERSGIISYANKAASQILGLTADELAGKDSFASEWKAIKEDGSPFLGDEHPSMISLRKGKAVENVIMGVYSPLKKQRTWININSIPKFKEGEKTPYQAVGIFEDVTASKEAVLALALSERRYRDLFEHTPIALWEEDLSEVIDTLNELKNNGVKINSQYFTEHPEVLQSCLAKIKIVEVNNATLTGHEAMTKDQLYQKLPELFTQASLKAMSNWLVEIANGNTDFAAESQFKTLKGEVRDTYMKAYLDKETSSIILAVMDTSEQKKAEKEIQKYQGHLEELVQERTEALEESNKEMEAFSYSVSHDLRAPLRAITGFSKFLIEDYSHTLDTEGKRYLSVIRDNAEKMDMLIFNLLKLSRTSRAELEYFDLNMKALARSMYMEVASQEEQAEFEFIVNDISNAMGDSTSIKQLWTNLIGNAVKYSAKSELKKIEIGTIDAEPGFVGYFVKDWGIGFNEAFKDEIFKTFKRLHKDDEFKGTGVGMAIAKRVVDKHNGKIWAESNENSGATFYFLLPKLENK